MLRGVLLHVGLDEGFSNVFAAPPVSGSKLGPNASDLGFESRRRGTYDTLALLSRSRRALALIVIMSVSRYSVQKAAQFWLLTVWLLTVPFPSI